MNDNPLVQGARGNFGKKLVYRKRGNDTLLVRMPSFNKKRRPSKAEKAQQTRFKLAALFAKGALSSAVLKAQYALKVPHNGTLYAVATKDYLTPPTIHEIVVNEYNGTIGKTITIFAEDDFRVMSAAVTICTATGDLVEKGNAVLDPLTLLNWLYTTTEVNTALAGSTVTVVVRDVPGNAVSKVITL